MQLTELHQLLLDKSGRQLFGEQGKSHPKYRLWARICHPDLNEDKDLAREVFTLLEQKVKEASAGITISFKDGTYEVEQVPFAKGDICDVYRTIGEDKLLKIARRENHAQYMEREKKTLDSLKVDKDDSPTLWSTLSHIDKAFTIKARNYPKRRVHVLDYNPNFIPLTKVKEAHPELNARHLAWIFRRMLLSLTVLHDEGMIHGCIQPQHFLVHKLSHAGKLIDFIHSVENNSVVDVTTKLKDFYPPEILKKEKATTASDIYMVGKVGVYLLGGHLPSNTLPKNTSPRIKGFLRAVLAEDLKMRPYDAWELHENFTELLERLYGPPTYFELTGV